MRRKKLEQLVRDVIDVHPRPVVTVRTLEIDFTNRTFTLDGRVVQVEAPRIVIPIVAGDAVFIPERGMERFVPLALVPA